MIDDIQRVTQIFETENLSRPVTRADEVPPSYAAISDEWLTDVVCRDDPGAKVVGHSFDERDDGSSNRRRIFISYNDAGTAAGLPTSVFCKAAETLQNRLMLGLSQAALTEANFYNFARPRLSLTAPEAIYAKVDPENFASLVMMRDLGSGVQFCDDLTEITRERAEQQIHTLAALHSRFYQSPELGTATLPFVTWPEWWGRTISALPDFGECCDRAFAESADLMAPRLYARAGEVWEATLKSVERHKELPRTLTHCDVHLKNWYIAGDSAMGLSDWQVSSIGHWSRDLIYTITTALTVENRRAWERDLVALYLDLMEQHGAPREPLDQVWINLRQQLMTALAFWTITLRPAEKMPDMQPMRTTLEFLQRLLVAVDDHESLDAF